jgi:hypothetical protein
MRNPHGNEPETKKRRIEDFSAAWRRAADRAERDGKPVLAVFFRSEAARMEEKARP